MPVKSRSNYQEYNLTEEDFNILVEAANGRIVGKWKNNGQTEDGKAERLSYAWYTLGLKYCFDPWTVLPITYNKILAKAVQCKDAENVGIS